MIGPKFHSRNIMLGFCSRWSSSVVLTLRRITRLTLVCLIGSLSEVYQTNQNCFLRFVHISFSILILLNGVMCVSSTEPQPDQICIILAVEGTQISLTATPRKSQWWNVYEYCFLCAFCNQHDVLECLCTNESYVQNTIVKSEVLWQIKYFFSCSVLVDLQRTDVPYRTIIRAFFVTPH